MDDLAISDAPARVFRLEMKTRDLIPIALALVSATGAVAYSLTYGIPEPACPNTPRTTRTFTVIADQSGYNGSRYQQGSWPVLSVRR